MDATRQRFLTDRVMTATPAQRVVMLYDRLALDLLRAEAARESEGPAAARPHLHHAFQIVAELFGSLDQSVGGPADNLAAIYGYLLRELVDPALAESLRIPALGAIIDSLRAAWTAVAAGEGGATAPASVASGSAASVPAGAGISWTA